MVGAILGGAVVAGVGVATGAGAIPLLGLCGGVGIGGVAGYFAGKTENLV